MSLSVFGCLSGTGRGASLVVAVGLALAVCPRAGRGVTIDFDYRFDQAGFFGTAHAPTPARTTLEWAGRAFESFGDSLAAIEPSLVNSWTATFENPTSGDAASVPNLVVAADRLVVFVGAYDLPGASLGEAGPGGGLPGSGVTAPFLDAITNRGEGDPQLDFAPWGGAIQFDTIGLDGFARQWHYDPAATPGPTAYDFYTVAAHELAHLLGFGTSAAFLHDVTGEEYVGATVIALNGGAVPLSGQTHWAWNVTSPPFVEPRPKPSLGPTLAPGERRLLTPLDYAALADIGWSVPPELVGLPGDADGDGAVDGSDLLLWQQRLGQASGIGDVTGDGLVDDLDRWLIKQHYGVFAASGARPVPEPCATAIVALATAMCAAARRRGRSLR